MRAKMKKGGAHVRVRHCAGSDGRAVRDGIRARTDHRFMQQVVYAAMYVYMLKLILIIIIMIRPPKVGRGV